METRYKIAEIRIFEDGRVFIVGDNRSHLLLGKFNEKGDKFEVSTRLKSLKFLVERLSMYYPEI